MTIYQVEEYYVHMTINITENEMEAIKGYLEDEGCANYEFQNDCKELVIDDIESESAGDEIEQGILDLIEVK